MGILRLLLAQFLTSICTYILYICTVHMYILYGMYTCTMYSTTYIVIFSFQTPLQLRALWVGKYISVFYFKKNVIMYNFFHTFFSSSWFAIMYEYIQICAFRTASHGDSLIENILFSISRPGQPETKYEPGDNSCRPATNQHHGLTATTAATGVGIGNQTCTTLVF